MPINFYSPRFGNVEEATSSNWRTPALALYISLCAIGVTGAAGFIAKSSINKHRSDLVENCLDAVLDLAQVSEYKPAPGDLKGCRDNPAPVMRRVKVELGLVKRLDPFANSSFP